MWCPAEFGQGVLEQIAENAALRERVRLLEEALKSIRDDPREGLGQKMRRVAREALEAGAPTEQDRAAAAGDPA